LILPTFLKGYFSGNQKFFLLGRFPEISGKTRARLFFRAEDKHAILNLT
jgi:hypothetical protein